MVTLADIPGDVRDWIRSVFKECNTAATQKLANNPNVPEEHLDHSLIDVLTGYSDPVRFDSGWTVELETHYIGGLGHFYRREIADLGIMLFAGEAGSPGPLFQKFQKFVLLQSKRLYPAKTAIRKFDMPVFFEIETGRPARRLGMRTDFKFDDKCKYQALLVRDDQYKAIEEYEATNKVRVYYSFYNPPVFPYIRTVPSRANDRFSLQISLGVRVVPSKALRQQVESKPDNYMPSAADLLPISKTYGWRLEDFIVDHFMQCKEGAAFKELSDEQIFDLFNRRGGNIAAVISINIEAP